MGIAMFPYQQPSETAVTGFPGSLRRLGHGGQGRTQAGLLPLEVRPEPMANAIAFDREVEAHKAHIREHGWLDVGTKGAESRFRVPVQLVQGSRR